MLVNSKNVPKYTEIDVLEKLGEGASGVVFKACTKKEPNDFMALKKITPLGYKETESLKEELVVSLQCNFSV